MSSPRVPVSSRSASSREHGDQPDASPARASTGLGGATSSERALGWALAAAAGLCLAACDKGNKEASAEKPVNSTDGGAKNCCHGKNECKGKGGCAVMGKHGCAGKNECKGQGGCRHRDCS